jgi:predicted amidohydrolase YtcJ
MNQREKTMDNIIRFFAQITTAIFVGLFLLPACSTTKQETIAKTIYFGGPILTIDESNPSAEAIAVQGGRILAVGTKEEVMRLAGKGTNSIDLAGKTLLPGFIDPHCHFVAFGAQAVGANLMAPPDGNVNNINDLVAELQKFAKGPDVKRTGWIYGMGYDNAVLAEGRHPTREDLDKVSTTVPVIATHISGHMAAVNSAGLKELGYNKDTKDPVGGVIRRNSGSNIPNGVLEELAAIPPMMRILMAPPTVEDQIYFMKRGEEMAKSFGYTTAQEGRCLTPTHNILKNYAQNQGLEIDVVSYIDYSDLSPMDSKWYSRGYKSRYRIGGMKITLDGSPQARTAWRTIPYVLPPAGQSKGYKGYPAIPDDQVVIDLFNKANANGWQVLTHTNGDAAADQLIRAVSATQDSYGQQDLRHVLIHGQFIRQDQLDSIAKLSLIPSLFPMHTFYWGDWYDIIIGPKYAQQISPMRSALDRGMITTSHSDSPVARPNLMRVMDATVNRTSRSGKVMGPDERITPMEALKSITIWGAYQHFEEDTKGSLEVGKLADLVILSDNPLTVDPKNIGKIKVLETIKEGKTIYQASNK